MGASALCPSSSLPFRPLLPMTARGVQTHCPRVTGFPAPLHRPDTLLPKAFALSHPSASNAPAEIRHLAPTHLL